MITRDAILAAVERHLMDNVPTLKKDEIDPSLSMKTLGANSLEVVEVVSCTMRELKIKVPRSQLSKLASIDDLVGLLHETSCARSAGQATLD